MTEESECPQHKAPGSPGKMHTVSMDRLKLLSKDVEQRRTVLGQSWDELQMVLSQYHASLVVRQEQFDMQCEDSNSYIAKLENELEKRNTEHDHLRSKLSEFERKVHGLEEENCSLRSEQERLAGELKVKENLVVKIQGQMSKEGLEYCAEISALKESLSKLTAEAEGRRKRPRVEEVPVSKSDATPRVPSPSAESPPTFSMATMPHLALPTTSSDVLEKQNDVPVTSQYEPMTSQPEVGHQVIQVPPLTQHQYLEAAPEFDTCICQRHLTAKLGTDRLRHLVAGSGTDARERTAKNCKITALKFDISSILTSQCRDPRDVETLTWLRAHSHDVTQTIPNKLRWRMTRNLVMYILSNFGKYPSTEQKKVLASCLVSQYPVLRDNTGSGYGTWYSTARESGKAASGYLEDGIKNMRRRTMKPKRQAHTAGEVFAATSPGSPSVPSPSILEAQSPVFAGIPASESDSSRQYVGSGGNVETVVERHEEDHKDIVDVLVALHQGGDG